MEETPKRRARPQTGRAGGRPASSGARGGRGTQGGRPRARAHETSEPPLLNERIRRHGKWIFVILIAVFAASSVLLGVGATANAPNLLDYLQNRESTPVAEGGDAAQPDAVRRAVAATKERPKDAAAWVALGDTYSAQDDEKQQKRNHDEAVKAYERAAALKPNDVAIQEKLGTAYSAQAGDASAEANRLFQEAQELRNGAGTGATVIPAGSDRADAFTRAQDAVVQQRASAIEGRATPFYTAAQGAATKAVAAYQRVAKARPNDARSWYNLGSVAASAGDSKTAISSYERFLKLVPGDPLADEVRESVKQLKQQATPGAAPGTTPTQPQE
jgi:cytochrome c-type biogenesis protein CcmH/NrfG